MMQSWSTANNDLDLIYSDLTPDDDRVCTANPYPYPDLTSAIESTGQPRRSRCSTWAAPTRVVALNRRSRPP
jgi:hypothetical protein